MNNLLNTNTNLLNQLIKEVGCQSIPEFSIKFDISQLQLYRLQNGLLSKMSLENVSKIATSLNISIEELIELFALETSLKNIPKPKNNDDILKDYQNLQAKYEKQNKELTQKFQLASVEILESLLVQLPTFIFATTSNPNLAAQKLLPLLKPIDNLLNSWNIKPLNCVGEKLPYNPQQHQLLEGDCQQGDLVQVRYIGYIKDDAILYKAKVSPV